MAVKNMHSSGKSFDGESFAHTTSPDQPAEDCFREAVRTILQSTLATRSRMALKYIDSADL